MGECCDGDRSPDRGYLQLAVTLITGGWGNEEKKNLEPQRLFLLHYDYNYVHWKQHKLNHHLEIKYSLNTLHICITSAQQHRGDISLLTLFPPPPKHFTVCLSGSTFPSLNVMQTHREATHSTAAPKFNFAVISTSAIWATAERGSGRVLRRIKNTLVVNCNAENVPTIG